MIAFRFVTGNAQSPNKGMGLTVKSVVPFAEEAEHVAACFKRRMSHEDENLERVRELCLSLPETSEANSWGHPNFRAGRRTFAAFEWVKGRPSVAVHLGAADTQAFLLQHEGSFETPYGRGKWVSLWADAELDDAYLQDLIERGYRSVALKRMLEALEDRESTDGSA